MSDAPEPMQPEPARYWLSRFVYLRAIGFVYTVAFLVLYHQWPGLIGERGLEPAQRFLARLPAGTSFWELPSIFRFGVSDQRLALLSGFGLGLSIAVMLGVENGFVMTALWALYMSFVHVGQDFYGYGWELLLLEAGFLAIFLCPWRSLAPLRDRVATPVVMWLVRWLVFRVMLGAGLIKIRGDACWRDLSCLVHHYETQPVPHPLSWLLHKAPLWFHQAGVIVNHLVELVAPFGVLGPRRARHLCGGAIVLFQAMLIASGNLSFLNWLTIAVALACFDDSLWQRVLPQALAARAAALQASAETSRPRTVAVWLLAAVVAVLSYAPIENMLSPRQRMNTSFDPLHLVNSYGAFGSVGKTRDEVILEGTSDTVITPSTRFRPYEFKCKPGDVMRRPCLITPYHHRLDWQMWFAALGDYRSEPFIVHLVYKLLRGEPAVLALMADNPFPEAPPRFVRAQRYRYEFTELGDASGAWWRREWLGSYLPPLSVDDPSLSAFLRAYGFIDAGE